MSRNSMDRTIEAVRSAKEPARVGGNTNKRLATACTMPREGYREETVRSLTIIVSAIVVASSGSAVAQGADPNLARNLAATCANCHGTNGVSAGQSESLAGMAKADIVRKMQEFKAGTKGATVMTQLAKGYTDEQIELIAGWFAAQKAPK